MATNPMQQFEVYKIGPEINFGGVNLSFTNASLFMIISSILILLFLFLGTKKKSLIPTKMQFITEGSGVQGMMADNEVLGIELPPAVILEVKEADPGLKGDTSSGATKPATLETGLTINVPLFINSGDKLKISTDSGEYLERITE